GVLPLHGHSFGTPALYLGKYGVVGARRTIIAHHNVRKVLTGSRILQIQLAPLIRIADSGTRSERAARDGAARAGKVNRRIGFVTKRHVNNVASDVICGNEPVLPELFLNAQIPLIDVGLFEIKREHGVYAV